MRNTPLLVIPCLLFIGACTHSIRPAANAAALATLRPATTLRAAPADAPTRVTTQADTPAPMTAEAAPTDADEPAAAPPRADATARHAFAPMMATERPEEPCGEARVGFAAGSSALDSTARGRLDAYAVCVTTDRAHAVYISGTTDPGSGSATLALADARARAVADYLHQDGLHMDFELHAYRAGHTGSMYAERRVGRSATVTTAPPHRAASTLMPSSAAP